MLASNEASRGVSMLHLILRPLLRWTVEVSAHVTSVLLEPVSLGVDVTGRQRAVEGRERDELQS